MAMKAGRPPLLRPFSSTTGIPRFYYIKMGLMGVYIIQRCYPDDGHYTSFIIKTM